MCKIVHILVSPPCTFSGCILGVYSCGQPSPVFLCQLTIVQIRYLHYPAWSSQIPQPLLLSGQLGNLTKHRVAASWVSVPVWAAESPLVPGHWALASLRCQSGPMATLRPCHQYSQQLYSQQLAKYSGKKTSSFFTSFSCCFFTHCLSSSSTVCLPIASNPLCLLFEGSQGEKRQQYEDLLPL